MRVSWLLVIAGCGNDVLLIGDDAVPACGNAVVEAGEVCDDGNDVDTDGCTNACASAACGDGIVQEGVEGCDDGNGVDTDACTSSCAPAQCGDGFVHAETEACDEGAVNGTTGATCGPDCRAVEVDLAGTSRPMDPVYQYLDEPVALHAADLDGDGTLDVGVVAEGNDSWPVFVRALNDGTGELWTPRQDRSVAPSGRMVVADTDDDGADDVVMTSFSDDSLVVTNGAPEGIEPGRSSSTANTAPFDPPSGLGPSELELAELSGDDDVDAVVYARTTEDLTLMRGDGNGQLDPRHTIPLPDVGSPVFWQALRHGDVTGDGLDDLVMFEYYGSLAVVWPRDRASSFSLDVFEEPVLGKSGGFIATSALLFDVDLDGDLEAVGFTDFDGGEWTVLDWGSGALSPVGTVPLVADGVPCRHLYDRYPRGVVEDLDGDGITEAVVSCDYTVGLVTHGTGRGDLDLQYLSCRGCGGVYEETTVTGLAVVDADGDGHLDVVAHWRGGEISVWWGDGTLAFDGSPDRFIVDLVGSTGRYEHLATGDIDADGTIDLVMDSVLGGGVALVRGVGGRRFLNPGVYWPRPFEPRFAVVDADGDGVSEPLVVGEPPGRSRVDPPVSDDAQLWTGLNVRGRTTSVETPIGVDLGTGSIVGTYPTDVAAGHLTADGFEDAVVVSDSEDRITVWSGTGDGGFDPGGSFTTGSAGTNEVRLVDLDGDGALDLLGLDPVAGVVEARLGQNDLGFSPPQFVTIPTGLVDVLAANLDGNGAGDLVVLDGAGAVHVRLASGSLAWSDPVALALPDGTSALAVASGEVNGDGRLDLAVLTDTEAVLLFVGFGNGQLSAPVTYGVGRDPQDVLLVDLDGDGIDDVVTANRGSDDLTVLRSFLP